jgi:hypothetical protein
MMIVFIIMTSPKNKWRLKNEAKLLKLYDVKPNNPKDKDASGKPQDGRKVCGRGRV